MHHVRSVQASTRRVAAPTTHTVPAMSTSHAGHKVWAYNIDHTVPAMSTSHAGHKGGIQRHTGGVLHNMLAYC